jgi:hypothetical protein
MALIDIDPSIVGAFVPTDALLEHKDTIGTAFWNQFVENGVAAYSLWRTSLAFGQHIWGSDLYCQIPPVNPSTYYAGIDYLEEFALRIGFDWNGNHADGTVTLYGGTSVASMGSLWQYIISTPSGSHFAAISTSMETPTYGTVSGSGVVGNPYFLKIVTSTPPVHRVILFNTIHITYKKYPNFWKTH